MTENHNFKKEGTGKVMFENKIIFPFTFVENDLIRSKSLSFEALGLYLILRSFGATAYPSVNYLCSLGKCGREKMYKIIEELIEAKLLLRKQNKASKGHWSKTIYRILAVNDNYEENYAEFIGEELINQQTLDNAKSQPCAEKPYTDNPYTKNRTLIRIIKQEEPKSKNTHTRITEEKEKSVCEDEKSKNKPHTPGYLKTVELLKNEDEHVLTMIEMRYKDAFVAAKYLDYQAKKGKIAVKNPCALLIKTLKDGLYSDVDEIIREEKRKKAAEVEKTKILKPVRVRELTPEEIKQQNDEWFTQKMSELNGGVQNDNSANV